MALNKKAGLLITRINNQANHTFIDGLLHISGNLEDVNQILTDVIFVPNKNFAEDFNISI